MIYYFYVSVLFLFLIFYFKIARKYNIVDRPNHRSSHSITTIRGGGILFPFALLIHSILSDFDYPLFTVGLLMISLVSFYDDLKPLSNKIRVLVHLSAVSLLFMQVGLMVYPTWLIILIYILVIGSINAYNFMDGINGITGAYSLITILTFYFINESSVHFVSSEGLKVLVLALFVYNFFNFRKKAKCFAGDVGSVSMAFIIIFFLLILIIKTEDLKYICLLLFYGLDTVSTIIFRLIRRENIFEAHRSHFYQFLVNVKGWPHLRVATLYLVLQLIVNILIVFLHWNTLAFFVFILVAGLAFVGMRFMVEGKRYLIRNKFESS